MNRDKTKSPKIGKRQILFQNRFQRLYRVALDFGTLRKDLYVTEYGPRAGMLVVCRGRVLLVHQYRYLLNGFSWEIPGGALDGAESPVQAAVRECLEETGVKCFHPRKLMVFHPGLDTVYNPSHIFLSTRCRAGEPSEEDEDGIARKSWVPIRQCFKMIANGTICDSLTLLALLAYRARRSLHGMSVVR